MRGPNYGFQTVGNSTLLAFDESPVLATDPWIEGSACFGSKILAREVPDDQRQAIASCPYLWISQDRSDYFHPESLKSILRPDTVALLPNHDGGRLKAKVEGLGFKTQVLPDGEWVSLSSRIRVRCHPSITQQAVLLVELEDRLIIHSYSTADGALEGELRALCEDYDVVFVTSPAGFETPLIPIRNAEGEINPVEPRLRPLGETVFGYLHGVGGNYFLPTGRLIRYQREDSQWCNTQMLAPLAHMTGYMSLNDNQALPAYAHWDFEAKSPSNLSPPNASTELVPSSNFGDDWSEPLSESELESITSYISSFEHLHSFLGKATFVVGGKEHSIPLMPDNNRELAIFAPRASLVQSVAEQRLGELLCSGFVSVQYRGSWNRHDALALIPHVLTFIDAIGERGGARTRAEIQDYLGRYAARGLARVNHPSRLPLATALRPYASPEVLATYRQ